MCWEDGDSGQVTHGCVWSEPFSFKIWLPLLQNLIQYMLLIYIAFLIKMDHL